MTSPESDLITVEVAFALPERQKIAKIKVEQGTTALQAVELSGLSIDFPDQDLANMDMGIFSKNLDGKLLSQPSEYVLKEKDRVEIYRSLIADPKAARAERAAKAKKEKAKEEREAASIKKNAKHAEE